MIRFVFRRLDAGRNRAVRQVTVEALIMAAEDRGPLMHARIGMLRALNRKVERTFSSRKDMQWGKRKLKRDQQ
jgi:hypothetical protein